MGGTREMRAKSAWQLLDSAAVMQVAAVGPKGLISRTMHGVVVDGSIVFHGGRTGEKNALVGASVVVSAHQVVALIASWMIDPVRACPATTWYRSVQAHGVLVEELDPDKKAKALQRMMRTLQPEGGHEPITGDNAMYAKAVRATRVLSLVPDAMVGREKLGQNKGADYLNKVLLGLWRRGEAGDLQALEIGREASPHRGDFWPNTLNLVPRTHLDDRTLDAVIDLVRDGYWNQRYSEDQLRAAHRNSYWVGLTRDGRLVATARAVSDVGKRAWVYDVAVCPTMRAQGVGSVLMRLLLDHWALRHTEVWLTTRDAMDFYQRLGFEIAQSLPGPPFPRSHMVRIAPPMRPECRPVVP